MNTENEIADEFAYNDQFKEDLIHQLWHLVEEIKKMNDHLACIADRIPPR